MVKKTVVLDTNFLLIPSQFGVDIFAELDRVCQFPFGLAVLPETVAELEKLAADPSTSLKDRKASKMALQLIKAKAIAVVGQHRKVFKSADKAILEFASAGNKVVIVATQDRALKAKLRAKGVTVAVLRQKKYIIIE